MSRLLIINGTIVNEGKRFEGFVEIAGERIATVGRGAYGGDTGGALVIDAKGKLVIPGVIDDQVHFREPGLTYKADIHSESIAAAAGGVTSYMEMPNTKPPATTIELLEEKFARAAETSVTNYSFYLGATNDNLAEISRIDPRRVCGLKVFMGSSTGNMLVDDERTLRGIFESSPVIIATHCEDEAIIRANSERYMAEFGDGLTVCQHPLIRSAEACYVCSARAVELASRYGARLHILHISTARELSLFEAGPVDRRGGEGGLDGGERGGSRSEGCRDGGRGEDWVGKRGESGRDGGRGEDWVGERGESRSEGCRDGGRGESCRDDGGWNGSRDGGHGGGWNGKKITNEVCVHHLWFSDEDYAGKGNLIKWNPAIKAVSDRDALRDGIRTGLVDVVATDHAPHTLDEKRQPYISSPSGGPLVQHSLPMMMELSNRGVFTVEQVVDKMCHNPARLFEVKERGFLREGYYADIAIVDPASEWTVSPSNILYKCGWSPLEGERMGAQVTHTIINGSVVYAGGRVDASHRGRALVFER